MFYVVVTVFPIIAIISGIISLFAVVKFVSQIYTSLKDEDQKIAEK